MCDVSIYIFFISFKLLLRFSFMLLRMKNYFQAIFFIIICISRKDLIKFGLKGHCCLYYWRRAYKMKFFFHRWLNFSFDSFFLTFDTCIQLWNVKFFNLQSWKYFRRKNFYQIFDKNFFFWNTFHESKIKSLLRMT